MALAIPRVTEELYKRYRTAKFRASIFTKGLCFTATHARASPGNIGRNIEIRVLHERKERILWLQQNPMNKNLVLHLYDWLKDRILARA